MTRSNVHWQVLILFFVGFFGVACDSPVSETLVELDSPVLLLPLNGSDTADSVLLDWDDIPDAKKYEVQVSTNHQFTDLIHDSRVLDRSEDIVNRLTQGVRLFWRTRAHGKNEVVGPWSSIHSFTPVRQAFFPSYPNQVFPENGSKEHETSVILRWDPVPEAISYHLVVTIDEDMLLYEVDLEGLKTTSYFVEDLVLTYPYWWKIRSLNAAGYSDWSPVWIFEVKFQ
ncbi:fibronectin type III domain-containing protein [bacterium]|nr:fibronectin type III domain-containing protein [bacterium]